MQKPAKVQDKYFLKSLHEEIDLYDRKLAHLAKHEVFASEAERDAALGRMTTKRATLAKTAKKLVEDGIDFLPSELPRSFRPQPEEEVLVQAEDAGHPQTEVTGHPQTEGAGLVNTAHTA